MTLILRSPAKIYARPYHWVGRRFYLSGMDSRLSRLAHNQANRLWSTRRIVMSLFDPVTPTAYAGESFPPVAGHGRAGTGTLVWMPRLNT